MIKLYLVRHGQTDYNLNGIVQNKNVPLNNTGIKQIEELRKKFNSISYDLIFSSPYVRTVQTANILNIKNKSIVLDDRLRERFMGDLELNHMTYDSYNGSLYWDYSKNLSDRNIESIHSMFFRVESFINYLKDNYNNKTIIIVSHSALIRTINHVIKNTDRFSDLYNFKVENGSVYEYTI